MDIWQIILISVIILAFLVTIIVLMRQINSLSRTLDEKIDRENKRTQDKIDLMNESVNRKIDLNNTRVQDSISRQLTESGKQMRDSKRTIAEISARLATINETNKHVESVADELKTLQTVLQNPKQRGVFGEYYLDTVLGNVLPVGSYDLQYKFKDGEIVDAVVYLDKGKVLQDIFNLAPLFQFHQELFGGILTQSILHLVLGTPATRKALCLFFVRNPKTKVIDRITKK